VAVHHRDAWEALGALLPPKQGRGLILIDPPFEEPAEFSKLATGLTTGHARFGTGVFAAWYPIKHRAPVRAFMSRLQESGIRDVVVAELCLREPVHPARLNGCGMLVINPPYRFEQDVPPILSALLDRLGNREAGEGTEIRRIADE
jgi:23S rRNA (adenine2030-N6)-methyltransferase